MRKTDKDKVEREALAFRKAVGERLRDLRLAASLNQDEFAFAAHIHRAHVGKIENGTVSPTLDTLYKVSRALGVSPDEVIGPATEKR